MSWADNFDERIERLTEELKQMRERLMKMLQEEDDV